MVKSLFPASTQARRPSPGKRMVNKKLDFLLSFRFITKAEHTQILLGNMTLYHDGQYLMNLNADRRITPILTGECAWLYKGRADDVNVHLLFGAPLPDPPSK